MQCIGGTGVAWFRSTLYHPKVKIYPAHKHFKPFIFPKKQSLPNYITGFTEALVAVPQVESRKPRTSVLPYERICILTPVKYSCSHCTRLGRRTNSNLRKHRQWQLKKLFIISLKYGFQLCNNTINLIVFTTFFGGPCTILTEIAIWKFSGIILPITWIFQHL